MDHEIKQGRHIENIHLQSYKNPQVIKKQLKNQILFYFFVTRNINLLAALESRPCDNHELSWEDDSQIKRFFGIIACMQNEETFCEVQVR